MPPKGRRKAPADQVHVSARPQEGPLFAKPPSSPAARPVLEHKITGLRIPVRGWPGGAVRLPPMTLAQLGLVGVGAALGGLLVYSATGEQQPGRVRQRPRPKRTALAPATGILATDALSQGSPGSLLDVLIREAYVTAHDRSKRHPAWTAEHLTRENLRSAPTSPSNRPLELLPPTAGSSKGSDAPSGPTSAATPAPPNQPGSGNAQSPPPPHLPDRSRSQFEEDKDVPEKFRAKLIDYLGSGYDRGHMVAAADARRSQHAMNETFLLSNISPQVGEGFNRHYWAWLESWCRNLTNQFEDVYVFTVPLYLPKLDAQTKKWHVSYEVIGPPGLAPSVSVPTHFAKVVLTRTESDEAALGAFVLPNAKIPDLTPLESFSVPVDSVERASGYVFFEDEVKERAKALCEATHCEVVRRFFDEAGNVTVLELKKPDEPTLRAASRDSP